MAYVKQLTQLKKYVYMCLHGNRTIKPLKQFLKQKLVFHVYADVCMYVTIHILI